MSAEEIVDGMFEAFNAQDLDRLESFFVDDVPVLAFPSGELLADRSGSAFHDRFRGLFKSNPDLHGELVSRVVKGQLVINQEWMAGFANGEAHTSVVLYEVGTKQIERVWFVV